VGAKSQPPGVAQDVLGLGEYLFKKVPLVKSLVLFLPQAFPNKFSAGVAPAPLKSLPQLVKKRNYAHHTTSTFACRVSYAFAGSTDFFRYQAGHQFNQGIL